MTVSLDNSLDIELTFHQAIPLEMSIAAESRITLNSISWQEYEGFLSLILNRPNLRLSYLKGTLEIMPLSFEEEALKTIIARLLYVYADVMGIDLFSSGSTTFKKESPSVGLEPDESYCLDRRKEFPDLAIEIIVTSGGIDKLEIYRRLEVKEVWFWQDREFAIYHLREDKLAYDRSPPSNRQSNLFPQLDFLKMAEYVIPESEPQAVRTWRQVIQSSL
jgi:Uma2 family endonuclease